jgi:hypothetical protein
LQWKSLELEGAYLVFSFHLTRHLQSLYLVSDCTIIRSMQMAGC